MKKIIATLALGTSLSVVAQIAPRAEYFPLSSVRLTTSPFYHAQQMDIDYLMGLNADRLLAPYLKEAGLTPKAENYPNWENTGLDGHIGGHYLSALSLMYASTGDTRVKERLEYFLSELKRCQADDGYLCGVPNGRAIWTEIHDGNIRAYPFGLNDRWVPLYNIHKIYNGLKDAYVVAGYEEARDMLVRLTDWMLNLTSSLSDDQIQDMLRSEHGGLNEVFADVYAITGDSKYLSLAQRFSHRVIVDPLAKREDRLTGIHANTQIPKVIGFERVAQLGGDASWHGAAEFFWHTVVDNRSISIGGNSVREHFHPADNFQSMIESEQGPETCNTYNMLRLTKMLYADSRDADYMDYYERALYNHILSSQSPVQGGFVYFTPMRPAHYRVYSQPQTSFWCCVGSGLENHARYGEAIYAHSADTLFVNLFIPSTLHWNENGVSVQQLNTFPDEASTTIVVNEASSGSKLRLASLKVRCPRWTNGASVSVNGKEQRVAVEDGYFVINRKWKSGDVVKIEMPMHLSEMQLPDGSQYYSYLYGPIVLAADMGKADQVGLYADDSRGGHIAVGPKISADKLPVVIADKTDSITKNDGLNFSLGVSVGTESKVLPLIPFYRICESRYMVYFRRYSQDEYSRELQNLAIREQLIRDLDSHTIDHVICGEQQPESDHAVSFVDSKIGDENGVHWREANGSFTYIMNVDGANSVRITYQRSKTRDARLLVNDVEVSKLTPDESGLAILPLPEGIAGKVKVTIAVSTSKTTLRIFDVRTIKTEN